MYIYIYLFYFFKPGVVDDVVVVGVGKLEFVALHVVDCQLAPD